MCVDRWLHLGAPTHVMTGDPSAATLATWYAMGVRNFDVRAAYQSLKRQATVENADAESDIGCPGQCLAQRPALDEYLERHYAANDDCSCWGGAAETLEDSISDSALGYWAGSLGLRSDARMFAERGTYWKNTFDPAVGYQAARQADGSWTPGWSPSTGTGFAQGTSAQYTWLVPQDVQGLSTALGGDDAAVARLDAFFHDSAGAFAVTGGDPTKFDPTNEPDIHTPWMYNALGKPWKTQETVRQVVDDAYTTGPSGLPGNDDLGTMSAWYVFASIGLFPQTPGRAEMLVGSPTFTTVDIRRSSGSGSRSARRARTRSCSRPDSTAGRSRSRGCRRHSSRAAGPCPSRWARRRRRGRAARRTGRSTGRAGHRPRTAAASRPGPEPTGCPSLTRRGHVPERGVPRPSRSSLRWPAGRRRRRRLSRSGSRGHLGPDPRPEAVR